MECPTCEEDLPTRQGMRQHHTKVHGEHLPNRTCVDCGDEFYHAKAQRKFCYACNPNAGENNGNWKDAKDESSCKLCGQAFEYYPSDKKGIYCPQCVEESEEFLGEPYWEVHEISRVIRSCEHCNEHFELLESELKWGHGRFCCHKCLCLAMKESNEDVTYNKGWFEARRRTLERDEHECQECGIAGSELDYDLDVHHLKPVREFEDPSDAHFLENLVSLCRSCHVRIEWNLRNI